MSKDGSACNNQTYRHLIKKKSWHLHWRGIEGIPASCCLQFVGIFKIFDYITYKNTENIVALKAEVLPSQLNIAVKNNNRLKTI